MTTFLDPAVFALPAWAPTAVGVVGFMIYAGAETALCLRKLNSEGIAYYLLKGFAAILTVASLLHSFNTGAFLSQLFCLLAACFAITLRLRAPRRAYPVAPLRRDPGLLAQTHGARAMPTRSFGPGAGLCPARSA